MMQTTTADPHRVETFHEVEDTAKFDTLVASMQDNGWIGAPIVVINREDADPQAITGSHRIAAARETGTDIPTVDLADLLADHNHNLDTLTGELTDMGLSPEDATYEVIVRLADYLPEDTITTYGIDAH